MNLDDSDNRPNITTVLSTAEFYGLAIKQAQAITAEVAGAIDEWQDRARRAHIARADIELTASAFSAHAEYRA